MPIDVLYEETYPWKFQKPGTRAHNINSRDPILLEVPVQLYETEAVRKFQVPLWNPYLQAGVPELAAGIFGVFYPPNLVYYLLPEMWAVNADVLLHAFLAGLFMYYYVRFIGRSVFGGLIAGVTFMFSGSVTLYYAFYTVYHVICWLPLAFLCIEKLIVRQRFGSAVALGGVIGVQFLSGLLEFIFYNCVAIAVYTGLRYAVIVWEARSFRAVKRPLGMVALAVGIGLALGAIQLIPTLELVPLSQRIFRSYDEILPLGRTSWLSVLTALSPNVFGSYPDRNWFGPGFPINTMTYIGVSGLVLMFICLLTRRDRYMFVLTGVGLMTWLIALGTPLVYFLYTFVPGFSGLRQVGRILYLYTVVAAAMAGLGAATLEQTAPASTMRLLKRFLIGAVGIWTLIVVGVFGIAVGKDRLLPVAMEFFAEFAKGKGWVLAKSPVHYAERIGWMIQYELYYAVIFLVMSGIVLLLIAGYWKGWLRPATFKVALATAAVVDLLQFPLAYTHIVDSSKYPLYEISGSIAFLKQDQDKFRVLSLLSCGTGQAFHPNTLMPYGIEAIQAYNSLLPGRFGQFVRSLEEGKIMCGGEQHQNLFMLSRFRDDGMTQLLNVKYVATPPVAPILQDAHLRLVFDGEVRLYENLRFLPRAFFVPNASWADQDETILARLRRDDFEPRSLVVLKGDPGGQTDRRPSPEGLPAEVSVVDYQPSKVNVAVNAPTDGWIVLLDNDFPGWRASVDGNPAKIYQANFTFRAVNVPSGRHRIEFSYRPLSFTLGALVTSGALLACAVILWSDRRRSVVPQC
ncbi:MAG: YfhO family protein [Desulfomonile tiedjei]|nr:YfhO family protein [Desulfomonile tiedjei]